MFKAFTKMTICSFAAVFCLTSMADAQSCQLSSNRQPVATQRALEISDNRRQDAQQLEGDWNRTVGDKNSGADVAFSFFSNGDVKWELATIKDGKRDFSGQQGTYKISGNIVSLSYDDGGSDEFQFSIVGDVLKLAKDGRTVAEVDRVRSGNSRKQFSELGEWKAEEQRDGKVILAADMAMKKDGQFKLVINRVAGGSKMEIEGTYEIDDNQLIVESDEGTDRIPLRIGKSHLEIEFVGAKFKLTPDGNDSSISLIE